MEEEANQREKGRTYRLRNAYITLNLLKTNSKLKIFKR